MKKGLAFLSIVVLMLAATFLEAGPFRRLFSRPAPGCANGKCEIPAAPAQAAPDDVFGDLPMRSLDGKSFAGALQEQLAKNGTKSPGERRLMRILNSPDSAKRDRQITRMERHVRAHLDLSPTEPVNWGAIDWPTLFQTILQLLLKLLPLLL